MLGFLLANILSPHAFMGARQAPSPGFVRGKINVRNGAIRDLKGGQGPVVVLLHGFPEDHSAYRNVIPILARRFTVVVPDLRGIGDSTSNSSRYDPEALSDDIRDLVTGLSLGRVYVVGHDFSGPGAYAYARRFPKETRGVMLIEAPLVGTPVWPKILNDPRDRHVAFHQQPRLPEALIAGQEVIYFREHFFGPKLPKEDVERYARAYSSPGQLAAALGIYRAIRAQGAYNRSHRGRLAVPIVLVGAPKGLGPLTTGMARGLRGWECTRVSIATVPDSGRYVADDQPEALAELIARYGKG